MNLVPSKWRPSWPFSPDPHVYIVPLLVTATTCYLPADIFLILKSIKFVFGHGVLAE